jgi:hypothetical protein
MSDIVYCVKIIWFVNTNLYTLVILSSIFRTTKNYNWTQENGIKETEKSMQKKSSSVTGLPSTKYS